MIERYWKKVDDYLMRMGRLSGKPLKGLRDQLMCNYRPGTPIMIVTQPPQQVGEAVDTSFFLTQRLRVKQPDGTYLNQNRMGVSFRGVHVPHDNALELLIKHPESSVPVLYRPGDRVLTLAEFEWYRGLKGEGDVFDVKSMFEYPTTAVRRDGAMAVFVASSALEAAKQFYMVDSLQALSQSVHPHWRKLAASFLDQA